MSVRGLSIDSIAMADGDAAACTARASWSNVTIPPEIAPATIPRFARNTAGTTDKRTLRSARVAHGRFVDVLVPIHLAASALACEFVAAMAEGLLDQPAPIGIE
jgi:hypothetical protein